MPKHCSTSRRQRTAPLTSGNEGANRAAAAAATIMYGGMALATAKSVSVSLALLLLLQPPPTRVAEGAAGGQQQYSDEHDDATDVNLCNGSKSAALTLASSRRC